MAVDQRAVEAGRIEALARGRGRRGRGRRRSCPAHPGVGFSLPHRARHRRSCAQANRNCSSTLQTGGQCVEERPAAARRQCSSHTSPLPFLPPFCLSFRLLQPTQGVYAGMVYPRALLACAVLVLLLGAGADDDLERLMPDVEVAPCPLTRSSSRSLVTPTP